MKRYLYCVLFISLLHIGCNNEIGYLESQYASYSIDSIVIFNTNTLHQEIAKIDDQISDFDSLFAVLAVKDSLYTIAEDEHHRLAYLRYDIEDEKAEYEASTSTPDPNVLADFDRRILEADSVRLAYYNGPYSDAIDAYYEVEDQISELGDAIGLEPSELKAEVDFYKKQVKDEIPWNSSLIEGVLGTKPLLYSIYDVTTTNGNAAELLPYLSVMGGGRIQVSPKNTAPIGIYMVSLKVENEGNTRILKDVLKIIVR